MFVRLRETLIFVDGILMVFMIFISYAKFFLTISPIRQMCSQIKLCKG